MSNCYPVVTGKGLAGSDQQYSASLEEDDSNQAPIDANEVRVRYATSEGGTPGVARAELSLAVFC